MDALGLVKLAALMAHTTGSAEVRIGLIDGPVDTGHPDLAGAHLREISVKNAATCLRPSSISGLHGTFIAGILAAKRHSSAPAICPGCTLLIRPIFHEEDVAPAQMPRAATSELTCALIDCIDAGAHVINLSLAPAPASVQRDEPLESALNHAARRGVIVVAAAGNQGSLCSSSVTRHPWVIPVVACDREGRPMNDPNLGTSIGRRGLSAPGDGITSTGAAGRALTQSGTSVAVPFVTGAVALLRSQFPGATADV